MRLFKANIFSFIVVSAVLALFSACAEEQLELPTGRLQLTIGQVSSDLQSRAVPADLPDPVIADFNIKLQRKGSDIVAYNGKYAESIEARVGQYDVTASYGDNAVIAKDAPYYRGTAEVEIKKDETTSATISCAVANALVSVKFGADEEERARFERFYTDYGILVHNANNALSIGKDETASSIYFPAGSSPEIVCYGTLKTDGGRTVSMTLSHSELPTVFEAADHAIITITLPDPESALVVNISKVQLQEARLDETIPLSWLPVPQVTAEHNFGTSNMLVGTDLKFSNAYPEMTWEARVSDEDGDTVRTIVGTGALVSDYKSSQEWPYLSPGKYKATFFLHTDGEVAKVSSREFMIPEPKLAITFGGYTSHSLYEEGDIEAANRANGFTLYEPMLSVNISPTLIDMEKYDYHMEYTFDGEITESESNYVTLSNMELDARLELYELSADVTFDGIRLQSSKKFRITGIPFLFEPPTTDTWEKNGKVNDQDGYARFGYMSDGAQTFTYDNVAIPSGTNLALDYKFMVTGDLENTFTISVGEQQLVSESASAWAEKNREGTAPFTTSSVVTYIRCRNSYGAGSSYTDLYRVGIKYRQ